jgi:hypothetical protein
MSSGGLPSLDPLSGPIPQLAYPRLEKAAADQLLTSLRDCSDTWGAGATFMRWLSAAANTGLDWPTRLLGRLWPFGEATAENGARQGGVMLVRQHEGFVE